MTPFESAAFFDGRANAIDRDLCMQSRFVASLMNCWVTKGHKVQPEDLYRPKDYREKPNFVSKDDFVEYMRKRGGEDG